MQCTRVNVVIYCRAQVYSIHQSQRYIPAGSFPCCSFAVQWSNCTTQCTTVNGSFPSCSFELLCSAASLAAVPAVARALQCSAVRSTSCVPYGSFPYCSFAFIYCTTATAPLSAPDSTVASLAAVSLPAVLCFEASPAAVPAVARHRPANQLLLDQPLAKKPRQTKTKHRY